MATQNVRSEDARGVDFEVELQTLLDIHERVREAREKGLDAKFPSLDVHFLAGFRVPNRGRRLESKSAPWGLWPHYSGNFEIHGTTTK